MKGSISVKLGKTLTVQWVHIQVYYLIVDELTCSTLLPVNEAGMNMSEFGVQALMHICTLGVPGLISFMAYLYTHRGAKGVK